MSRNEFPVVAAGIVTNNGDVLIGKKEEVEDHPISGEWHFPGGHLGEGENIEKALKREIDEETGLDVQVHQIIDTYYGDKADLVRVLFHCESKSRNAEPRDDLEGVKWVEPGEVEKEIGEVEEYDLQHRDRIKNFIEKLKKMPVV